MAPEDQWLVDVVPIEIVPLSRGHVSFWRCRPSQWIKVVLAPEEAAVAIDFHQLYLQKHLHFAWQESATRRFPGHLLFNVRFISGSKHHFCALKISIYFFLGLFLLMSLYLSGQPKLSGKNAEDMTFWTNSTRPAGGWWKGTGDHSMRPVLGG